MCDVLVNVSPGTPAKSWATRASHSLACADETKLIKLATAMQRRLDRIPAQRKPFPIVKCAYLSAFKPIFTDDQGGAEQPHGLKSFNRVFYGLR
jgi:hypothetical protein